jgi:hypothetical protein
LVCFGSLSAAADKTIAWLRIGLPLVSALGKKMSNAGGFSGLM